MNGFFLALAELQPAVAMEDDSGLEVNFTGGTEEGRTKDL